MAGTATGSALKIGMPDGRGRRRRHRIHVVLVVQVLVKPRAALPPRRERFVGDDLISSRHGPVSAQHGVDFAAAGRPMKAI